MRNQDGIKNKGRKGKKEKLQSKLTYPKVFIHESIYDWVDTAVNHTKPMRDEIKGEEQPAVLHGK